MGVLELFSSLAVLSGRVEYPKPMGGQFGVFTPRVGLNLPESPLTLVFSVKQNDVKKSAF